MKTKFIYAAAVAATFGLASCSSDAPVMNPNEDAVQRITVTVSNTNAQSRAGRPLLSEEPMQEVKWLTPIHR